ncbi:ferredoxin [archaeon]|nr:MAG: ferredoxin [archaeon]
MVKIKVDKETCIGCNLCMSICPDVFGTDKDGKSEVLEDAKMEVTNDVIEAKNSCPVKAIIIEE